MTMSVTYISAVFVAARQRATDQLGHEPQVATTGTSDHLVTTDDGEHRWVAVWHHDGTSYGIRLHVHPADPEQDRPDGSVEVKTWSHTSGQETQSVGELLAPADIGRAEVLLNQWLATLPSKIERTNVAVLEAAAQMLLDAGWTPPAAPAEALG
jgi:hypothetical protein